MSREGLNGADGGAQLGVDAVASCVDAREGEGDVAGVYRARRARGVKLMWGGRMDRVPPTDGEVVGPACCEYRGDAALGAVEAVAGQKCEPPRRRSFVTVYKPAWPIGKAGCPDDPAGAWVEREGQAGGRERGHTGPGLPEHQHQQVGHCSMRRTPSQADVLPVDAKM